MPDTTTAGTLITRAMKSLNLLASGETPNANDAQDAFDVLNEMVSNWGTNDLTVFYTPRSVYTLTTNTQTYTIGSGGVFNQQWPESITNAGVIPAGTTLEVPIQQLTLDEWAHVPIKTTQSPFPTALYYDRNFSAGLGTVTVWPIPTTAAQLVLYTPQRLAEFANLATSYYFPPGYTKALRMNLAVELAREFGVIAPDSVIVAAALSLADIKRKNITLYDATVDEALMRKSDLFNYYTGTPL